MTRLLAKVCGLTTANDAAQAALAGADLLGFVRHAPSPRHCLDLGVAAAHLDRAVLVMVAEAEAILAEAKRHGFRRVQAYLPEATRAVGARLLRDAGLFLILPWADEAGQDVIAADLYLWETGVAATGVVGGSGQTHAMRHAPPGPFLLAGGLDATNATARLAAVPAELQSRLRGADAASRLEAAPGRKDPARVTAFVHAIHARESA